MYVLLKPLYVSVTVVATSTLVRPAAKAQSAFELMGDCSVRPVRPYCNPNVLVRNAAIWPRLTGLSGQ